MSRDSKENIGECDLKYEAIVMRVFSPDIRIYNSL